MTTIRIVAAGLEFTAHLDEELAPETCAAFCSLLPLSGKLLQARWSGESAWMPLGDLNLGVGLESPTSTPAPGQLLFHPHDVSETEILFPYGRTRFGSKHGTLVGTPFLRIISHLDRLEELGRRVVWEGAQDVRFADAGGEAVPPVRLVR